MVYLRYLDYVPKKCDVSHKAWMNLIYNQLRGHLAVAEHTRSFNCTKGLVNLENGSPYV
jgi:hypothetical protein